MTRILLCDDSPFILTIFESRLKNKGLQVVGKASTGDECIKMYQGLQPDVVLLDITMPQKSGTVILKELIQIDPQANVIIVSAVRDESVINDCLKSGAKAYIPKSTLSLEEEFSSKVLEAISRISINLQEKHSVKR